MKFLEILKHDTSSTMSPARAFLISMLYMISADEQIESQEIARLLTITGSTKTGPLSLQAINQKSLDLALHYRSHNSLDHFLLEVTPILSHLQKKCILLNIFECAISDQEIDIPEQAVFDKFIAAFEVPTEELSPHLTTILLKNNFSIFSNNP